MKGLTPAERREALKGFVDDSEDQFTVLDRSTLERWADCPFAAKAVDDNRCGFPSYLAVGQEVHEAFARATLDYVEANGDYTPGQLKTNLVNELRGSRPDVQPDVISAAATSAWAWASHLGNTVHPGNILGFDGGEAIGRSGQLAMDFPDLRVRVTSELDILYSTESTELLAEDDYKSGWKYHTAADVYKSFQFQMHAALVFTKYPEKESKVSALRTQIWNTRRGEKTHAVYFDRKYLPDYTARIRMAVQSWWTHRADPPTWPTLEKCSLCPAAAICPVCDESIAEVAADPAGFIKKMVAVEARFEAMKERAAKHVDATGQDIQSEGVYFGRNKPASKRKPAAVLYSPKEKANGSDSDT